MSARRLLTLISAAALCVSDTRGGALDAVDHALGEGLPEIALGLVRRALPDLPAAQLPRAKLLHAEALIRSGKPGEALEVLREIEPESPHASEILFMQGEAFAASGEWERAAGFYLQVATDPPLGDTARVAAAKCLLLAGNPSAALERLRGVKGFPPGLLEAEAHLALGDRDAARETLARLAPGSSVEQARMAYTRARVAFANGAFDESDSLFGEVLKTRKHADPETLIGATLGRSESRLAAGRIEEALRPLERFLSDHPNHPSVERVFRQLDRALAADPDASDGMLRTWAEHPGPIQAPATLSLARLRERQARFEEAVSLRESLADALPDSPYAAEGMVDLAEMHLRRQRTGMAFRAIARAREMPCPAAARERLDFLAGIAYYRRGDLRTSEPMFRSVANDSEAGMRARFNAALVRLTNGDQAGFVRASQEFENEYPGSPLLGDLLLEAHLVRAREQDPEAANALSDFAKNYPEHPRLGEAYLALAELHYLRGELDQARALLDQAARSGQAERAAFLSIILTDARPGTAETLLRQMRAFLNRYPDSEIRPEVLMKLGELYYGLEDFPSARAQFELVASDYPGDDLSEKALFLAAQSAMRARTHGGADDALTLFEQVFRRGGPLKLRARLEQASIKVRQGKSDEALVLFDSLLDADPPPELAAEALIGKGEALFSLGNTDPTRYGVAAEVFRQIASDPESGLFWKNQALWKLGQSLEKLGQPEDALLAYYEAVETTPGPSNDAEFLWFYKCGFDAARLLEAQEKWGSAAALYDKLAEHGGRRSAEAKARRDRLRLEHFLWPEEPAT